MRFVQLAESHVMLRIFIEGLDAKRAAKRDHSIFDIDVAYAAAVLDGFLADDAALVPVLDTLIFIHCYTFGFISSEVNQAALPHAHVELAQLLIGAAAGRMIAARTVDRRGCILADARTSVKKRSSLPSRSVISPADTVPEKTLPIGVISSTKMPCRDTARR